MNRFEELIAKYLDDTATPNDEAELGHLIQRDGENRQEFLACYDFDQLLTVLHKPANDTSIEAILTQLRAESDPFVESVAREIRESPPRTFIPHRAPEPDRSESSPSLPRSGGEGRGEEGPLRGVRFTGRGVRTSYIESWWKQISRWLDGRRLLLGVSGALVLALITGLIVWFFGPTMGDPILAEFQGNAVSVERGTEFIPASIGLSLKPADILRTGMNETAALTFGREHTRLDLHPGTELKLAEMSRGKRFTLRVGKLEASAARQRPFRAMVIMTPQAEARVLGTKFTLLVDTNGTRLEVTEGKVRLTRASDGKAVKVTSGYYAPAAPNAELAALPQTGSILYEYWTNVSGIFDPTWDVKLGDHPDGMEYLALFEAKGKSGDNFGERIRGYVHPPKTGDYTFWIAGDGFATFKLSRDDQPRNKVRLATSQETKKQPREWTNQGKQQSTAITLVAGRKYYIEAVQNDHYQGEHHLAVAWQGPDREREVIPGQFLSPFETKTKEKKR
jgi:hypothetical protein